MTMVDGRERIHFLCWQARPTRMNREAGLWYTPERSIDIHDLQFSVYETPEWHMDTIPPHYR